MRRIKYFKTVKLHNIGHYTNFNSINAFFKGKTNYRHITLGWIQAEKFVKLIDVKLSRQKTIIYDYPQFKHLLK